MRIAIIGAGSLGLLFAVRFQQHTNEDVYLITRTDEQKKEIQKEQIELEELDGTSKKIKMNVFSQFDKGIEADWIFVMVKQVGIQGIENVIRKWANDDTKVVCFQNGLGHIDYLKQNLTCEVYSAVTTEGALRMKMSQVVHTGTGEIWLGNLSLERECNDLFIEKLIYSFNQAGFRATYSEKIKEKIWRKIVINAVVNPLTALLELKNGELLDESQLRNSGKRLLSEINEVIRHSEIQLEEDMEEVVEEVCRQTRNNESSMLQDIRKGRKTEIDSITGPIIKLGKKVQIATPLLEGITRLVHAKEKQSNEGRDEDGIFN